MPFKDDPYRRNAFDAFPLRKDEVGIRAIRQLVQSGRESWREHGGKVQARDGTEWELSEAQLNSLERSITDPLSRLQLEQFVHQQHYFATDTEIAALIAALEHDLAPTQLPSEVLEALSAALAAQLTTLLPEPSAPQLEDDLPWPEPPVPFAVELEPIDAILLRER